MAIINGTSLPDLIAGTAADDQIFGFEGQDTILGSTGSDFISGSRPDLDIRNEIDVIDYSRLRTTISLLPTGIVRKGSLGQDQLSSIETIIAPLNRNNVINASSSGAGTSIQVDLGLNQLTVRDIPGIGNLSLTVQNFRSVIGTNSSDQLIGNAANNTFQGLDGDDFINGAAGIDTANYSRAEAPITLLPTGVVFGKGSGRDQLFQIEKIVGATNLANKIDASTAGGSASINVNLGNNSLLVNNALPSPLSFRVQNFVDVTGTNSSDTISGSSKNNTLNGLAGNDIILGQLGNDNLNGGAGSDTVGGGSGNDRIAGTDSASRGFLENDVLRGNAGFDQFILGDKVGSFYLDEPIIFDNFPLEPDIVDPIVPIFFESFAVIEDFAGGDLIQLGQGNNYQVFADAEGFDVFEVSRGIFDLIADVRTQFEFDLPTESFSLAAGESLDFFKTTI